MPRVSIALPVYNGERFVSDAIDSLLAQTFTDFELIISDNASTDRTETICRSYAQRDARIRYNRNEVNIGANNNFNRAFSLATAPYFMWAAHDDLRDPNFVAECVNILDSMPDVVLAYSDVSVIDENANEIDDDDEPAFRTHDPRPHVRYHDLVRTPHRCYQILGMYRAAALARTRVLGAYTSADFALLAELSLMGRFFHISRKLTFYRHHPHQSLQLDREARMAWSGSTVDAQLALPQWHLYFGLLTSIQRVPMSLAEQLHCYITMACWPFWFRNWRRMGKDVLRACVYLLRRLVSFVRSRVSSASGIPAV